MPHAEDGSSLYRFDQFERMNNSFAGGDNDYLKDVNAALNGVNAVWTIIMPELPTTQKSGVVNYALSTQFAACETVFERDDLLMQLYVRPPETEAIAIYGEDDLRLFDMARGYENEEAIHLVLAWWTEILPPASYSVALHLFDESGNLVAQTDFALPDKRPFSCTGSSLSLAGLPKGDYELRAKVYAWQTDESLVLENGEDYITLRTIHID
jgi:hypothetical protein